MERDLKIGRIAWVSALILIIGAACYYFFVRKPDAVSDTTTPPAGQALLGTSTAPMVLPPEKTLDNDYHIFQTFNNCAPAALSMALSYFGVNVDQETLANDLRPYHNSTGDNDDKSTPPPELAAEAQKYGLTSFYRADGNIDTLKKFVANGIPVVVRALFKTDEDIAHYRVIKGYDDSTGEIVEDDGFDGHNVRFSYDLFKEMWQPYNYAYLVMVPADKVDVVKQILGSDVDEKTSWQHAADTAKAELSSNPTDMTAEFNLSVALYYTGDYQGSVNAFEKAQPSLGEHALWYQIEPIESYFALGNYTKVMSLTDAILNDNNRAFSELYVLRGKIYQSEGNLTQAKAEFQNAVLYNKNSKEAQDALLSVKS